MSVHIALLRAVNVAGHGQVAMKDLCSLAAGLGLQAPQTLLQSGNLIFRETERSPAELERLLEAEAAQRLGLRTDVLVRAADEWARIVESNPFGEEAARDPGHVVAMPLKDAPQSPVVEALRDAIRGRETIHADGRTLYIAYPDGIGRSKLTHALIERKLGTRGTGRNWNTVLKLFALAAG